MRRQTRFFPPRPVLPVLIFALAATVSCDTSLDLTGPEDSPRTASVDIRSSGFDSSFVLVGPGGEVTFTNRDTVPHQVASDPHPSHGRCPELNGPVLAPGERFRATMADRENSCGYHDERQLDVAAFRGTVTVCRQFSLLGC